MSDNSKPRTKLPESQSPEDVLAQLRQLEGAFDEAPVEEGRANWDDGTYHVKVANCTVDTVAQGKNQGMKRFLWSLRAISGKYEGKTMPVSVPLKDTQAMGRVKGRFKALGLPYDSLADCANSAVACRGKLIEIQLRTSQYKGEPMQFCDFRGMVNTEEEAQAANEVAEAATKTKKGPTPTNRAKKTAEDLIDELE